MLSFRICHLIIYARITEGGPFLIVRFKVRPVIRHVRNTEGRPFLMLRFEVLPLLDILEIQRADQFLCYVSRSTLSLDMLEIQRGDHFLAKQTNNQRGNTTCAPPPFLDTLYVRGNRMLHQNEYTSTTKNEKQPPTFIITCVQSVIENML